MHRMTAHAARRTIVIGGALAQRPRVGGHTWMLLQYILGFRRLGWDVLLLDRLRADACVDPAGQPCVYEDSLNARYVRDVLERFGLEGSYAVDLNAGGRFIGMSRDAVVERVRNSALLLNVMGFIVDPDILGEAPLRVFLDIDPGYGQMWTDLGLADPFRGHDAFVTIGVNIGRSACPIPTCGIDWIPTVPPVVLSEWPVCPAPAAKTFTSVATWRGSYGPMTYQGRVYGLRVHEFRRYVDMPRRTGASFELALRIHPADASDRNRLCEEGWQLTDPQEVAGDPWSYRAFIQRSAAEFMVAAGMPVQSASGWFSDRSVCYLATGRPVVALDTGIGEIVPTGRGLLTFRTVEEAAERVKAVVDDYEAHARAARALAEEAFDSDIVLARLLGRVGVA